MTDRAFWTRRDLLAAGTAASVGSLGGAGMAGERGQAAGSFRTRVCDILSIELPILQAPMSRVAGPALVAAVSNAGGLGILPGVGLPPEELREQIRAIRSLTSKPFAVNLLLHTALQPPIDPVTVSDDDTRRVNAVLNGFRSKLGLAASDARPPRMPDVIEAALDVILTEKVPVFSIGLGKPSPAQMERCRRAGATVIAMAATVADAQELASAGVDLLIAQGSEAGGHRSTWTKRPSPQHAAIGTLALVPQTVVAVNVPVVAAGGIVDGRGLAASLALGAGGVLMGTRFIASRESIAPEFYKQRLLAAVADDTTITDAFTGLYARVLRNELTETYAASGAPVFPPVAQQLAQRDIGEASAARGSGEFYPMYAGQGCGGVADVPTAADLVRRTIAEAREAIAALGALA